MISNGNIITPQDIHQNYHLLSETFKSTFQTLLSSFSSSTSSSAIAASSPSSPSSTTKTLVAATSSSLHDVGLETQKAQSSELQQLELQEEQEVEEQLLSTTLSISPSLLLQLDSISSFSWSQNGFGVMSAEGVLKDPALFQRYLNTYNSHHQQQHSTTSLVIPSLYELFNEYCQLSQLYSSLGGWNGFDDFERRKHIYRLHLDEKEKETLLQSSESIMTNIESKQVITARQHLTWMLGKSGHGRLVRYEYKGDIYQKHTQQMNALKEANSLEDLLKIAKYSLPTTI